MRKLGNTILVIGLALAAGGFSSGPAWAQLHNPCPYTNDGDCDEPNGLNLCAWGTDVADCSDPNSYYGSGSGYAGGGSTGGGSSGGSSSTGLMNPCPYTNDGDCDEPNGLGYCDWGTDVADCSNPNSNYGSGSGYAGGGNTGGGSSGGSSSTGLMNPCPYTNDGDCDEPNGLGYCDWGTDVTDCSNPNSNYGSGSGYAGPGAGGRATTESIFARLSGLGTLTNPVTTLARPGVITDVRLDGSDFCIWRAAGRSGPGSNTGLCGGQSYPNWRASVIGARLSAGRYFAIVQSRFAQGMATVSISVSVGP